MVDLTTVLDEAQVPGLDFFALEERGAWGATDRGIVLLEGRGDLR